MENQVLRIEDLHPHTGKKSSRATPIISGLERARLLSEGGCLELFRGRWAERLSNGQLIGIAGSAIENEQLDIQLQLDFSFFDPQLGNYTPTNFQEKLQEKREVAEQFLIINQIRSISPELFMKILSVQSKVDRLLQVNDFEQNLSDRAAILQSAKAIKLSDLIGNSGSAERALLAKHILDRIGQPCIYMSGVYAARYSLGATTTPLVEHSFLILPFQGKSLIFDVAAKHQDGEPRLVLTTIPLTAELFFSKRSLIVEGQNIFSQSRRFYGIGNPYLEQRVQAVLQPS